MQPTSSNRVVSNTTSQSTSADVEGDKPAIDDRRDPMRSCRGTAREMLRSQATCVSPITHRPDHRDHFDRLLHALDRARQRVGLPALLTRQQAEIRNTAKGNEPNLLGNPRRYAEFFTKVTSETARNKLSTAWIVSRIEKASGRVYTTSGDPGRLAKFNGRIANDFGGVFKCVDFSRLRLEDTLGHPLGKVDDKSYSNAAILADRLKEPVPSGRYRAMRASSTQAYIFQASKFGRFVARQLSEMKCGIRAGFLEPTRHSMMVTLKKKGLSKATRTHVASVFDANHSNETRRTEQRDPRALRQLGLCDFVAEPRLYPLYLGDGDETTIAFMHHGDSKATNGSVRSGPIPCTIEGPLTSRVLAHVLEGNLAIDLPWALDQLKQMSPREVAEVLQTAMPGRQSGIHVAVLDGHVEAVRAYTQLLRFALADKRCAALMGDQVGSWLKVVANGTHALVFALQDDDDRMLKAYGDLVLMAHGSGHVSDAQLQDLLTIHDARGVSALHAGAAWKCDRFVDSYLKLLRRVPHAQRAALLAMTAQNGVHGINQSLANDNGDLADRQFGILQRAHSEGLITGGELVSLSVDAASWKAWNADSLGDDAHEAFRDHLRYLSEIRDPGALVQPRRRRQIVENT